MNSVTTDLAKDEDMRTLQGQQYLVLNDEDVAYVVRSGYVFVYLVKLEEGRPSGPRHHIFTCHEGNALYGGATRCTEPEGGSSDEYALLAVAPENCQLERHDGCLGNTGGALRDGTLFSGLQNWVQHLSGLLSDHNRTQFAEKTECGGGFVYQSGQIFRTAGFGLRLLRIDQGCIYPINLEYLAMSRERRPVLTMTADIWFKVASEQTTGCFVDCLDASALDDELLRGVVELTRMLVNFHLKLRRDAEATEMLRFDRLEKLGHETQRNTVDLLRFERYQDPLLWMPRNTALMSALDLIGRNIGIKFSDDPMAQVRASRDEQIEAITRVSGTRSRHVRLHGTWWKDDVGHLLAFRKNSGTPVALICASYWLGLSRRYEMVDGETGERKILTPELAEQLEEIGFAFLRPLPVEAKASAFELSKSVMQPFIPDLRLTFLLSLLTGILGAAMPMANFMMTDKVIPDANRELMWDLGVGLAAMSAGMFLFGLSNGLLSIRMKTAITAQLQSAIMDRLLRLPSRFFRKYSSGDLLNRANMISEISAGMSMTTLGIVLSLISTVVMLATCFHYSDKLALLALVAAIVTSIFSVSFSFLIRKKALAIELDSGDLFGFVVQMVSGVTKLQIAGADQRALNQWAKRYGEQLRKGYAIDRLQHASGLINMTIQTLSTILLYYFAGTMVAQTAALQAVNPLMPPLLTIGTFFAVQNAFGSVVGGVVGFFGSFITIHQQLAKRELVRPLLEEPVEGGGVKADPGRLDGHVLMTQVTFRYQKDGPKILDNVSLKAMPGEFVALVGTSGSGKSTILKLLLGFDFQEAGQILFDKRDIADLDMLAVRRQIGVVLQDGKINSGTLYHAICGASNLSMDEAWEAAEAAGFAEDIKTFPMGMHTMLPEGASTLSGGQRQRLLIARALAIRPRIVFFDEATSALDNRTQAIVTASLRERRVTRIVIAHRLTTIIDADRIYVLDKGVITQSGSFAELMEQDGLFKRMASRQLA